MHYGAFVGKYRAGFGEGGVVAVGRAGGMWFRGSVFFMAGVCVGNMTMGNRNVNAAGEIEGNGGVGMPVLKSYEDAEGWLLSITDYERLLGSPAVQYNTETFDLERFREQLRLLGDPHLAYGVVHVAGTKGKGSTCAFVEGAFRACGFKTGLYTSPHLHKFTERIRVNGCAIGDEDFARLVGMMGGRLCGRGGANGEIKEEAGAQAPGFRTVFEILTAAAFQFFMEQGVEVAIIETGLGGRLDSTNVFDRRGRGPLVNVISAIGLDHTSVLGGDVGAIAREKAGIIRAHGRVVVARQPGEGAAEGVYEVVRRRVAEVGGEEVLFVGELLDVVPERVVGPNGGEEPVGDGDDVGYRFQWKAGAGVLSGKLARLGDDGFFVRPSLRGAHQAGNAATAFVALGAYEDALGRMGDEEAAERIEAGRVCVGLESAVWPGRFQEVVREGVDYVIDGAHCLLSAAALGRTCRERFGERGAVVVVGFLRDKTGDEILSGVFERVKVAGAVAVVPPTPRSASADHITGGLRKHLPPGAICEAVDMAEALKMATDAARAIGGYVVVYGSLYLVGPALDCLVNE